MAPTPRPPDAGEFGHYGYDGEPASRHLSDTASIVPPPTERPSSEFRRGAELRRDIGAVLPSTTEVTIYTLLGAAIASTVFVVGGRPVWHVGLVVLTALIIIAVSALISHRAPRPSRGGRRRRR